MVVTASLTRGERPIGTSGDVDEVWVQAVDRKNLNARDIVLRRAASPPERALRDGVLERVPSLAYLVQKLVGALSPPDVAGG